MKLLFDENLSCRLPDAQDELFPGSAHVRSLGLQGADDRAIWAQAGREGFVVVTKDDDFREFPLLLGSPPKLVILALGNSTTSAIRELLVARQPELTQFAEDPIASILELE